MYDRCFFDKHTVVKVAVLKTHVYRTQTLINTHVRMGVVVIFEYDRYASKHDRYTSKYDRYTSKNDGCE